MSAIGYSTIENQNIEYYRLLKTIHKTNQTSTQNQRYNWLSHGLTSQTLAFIIEEQIISYVVFFKHFIDITNLYNINYCNIIPQAEICIYKNGNTINYTKLKVFPFYIIVFYTEVHKSRYTVSCYCCVHLNSCCKE